MTPDEFKATVERAKTQADILAAAREKQHQAILEMEASARALFDDLWQQAFGDLGVRYFSELRSGFGHGHWEPKIEIRQVAGLSWTTQGWYKGLVSDDANRVDFPFEDAQPDPLSEQALLLFCEKASREMGIHVQMKLLEAHTWPEFFDLATIPAMFPKRKVEIFLTGEIDRGRFDDDLPDSFIIFSMNGEMMIVLQHGEDYCTYVFDSMEQHALDEAFDWLEEDIHGRWSHLRVEYHDQMLANWAALEEAKA